MLFLMWLPGASACRVKKYEQWGKKQSQSKGADKQAGTGTRFVSAASAERAPPLPRFSWWVIELCDPVWRQLNVIEGGGTLLPVADGMCERRLSLQQTLDLACVHAFSL